MQLTVKSDDQQEQKRLIYSLEMAIFCFHVMSNLPKENIPEWIEKEWNRQGLPDISELIE